MTRWNNTIRHKPQIDRNTLIEPVHREVLGMELHKDYEHR